MDRHKIWRIVRNNVSEMRDTSPVGYEPVVEVFLTGRSEPIRLNQVHTTDNPEFAWALLGSGLERETDERSPDERRVFTPEQYVQRIEISFVRSDRPGVGFSHHRLEEPAASNDE